MVCVPCFIIPVILYLFHRFVQPIIYAFWGEYLQEPVFSCPLPGKKKKPIADANPASGENASTSTCEAECEASSDVKVKSD